MFGNAPGIPPKPRLRPGPRKFGPHPPRPERAALMAMGPLKDGHVPGICMAGIAGMAGMAGIAGFAGMAGMAPMAGLAAIPGIPGIAAIPGIAGIDGMRGWAGI